MKNWPRNFKYVDVQKVCKFTGFRNHKNAFENLAKFAFKLNLFSILHNNLGQNLLNFSKVEKFGGKNTWQKKLTTIFNNNFTISPQK